jgi:hypothetical protein
MRPARVEETRAGALQASSIRACAPSDGYAAAACISQGANMRTHKMILAAALASGVAAVIAAMLAPAAIGAGTAVQYTQTTTANLGGVMGGMASLFGKKKGTTSTTTTSTNRLRTDNGDTSTIMQCDLKRILTLDNNAKTFYALTFDDLVKRMAAAANALSGVSAQNQAETSNSNIKGSGTVTITVDEKPDDQTQTIAGMTAHHVAKTLTIAMKGTGQCKDQTITMSTDEWYGKNEAPLQCPNVFKSVGRPVNPFAAMQGMPCMQNVQTAVNEKDPPQPNRLPLRTDTTFSVSGMKFGSHIETDSVTKIPYDPKFFDVPAGYTQVSPPPMPTAPPQPQH